MRLKSGSIPLFVCCCIISLLMDVRLVAQQQISDPEFRAVVERPAYPGGGPIVAVDEAHSNFHTAGGQYKPFADLLRSDGYKVIASKGKFETGSLAGIDVLVIANARDLEALMAGRLTSPAFTEHECDVVQNWVRTGGSLLLIADHAPFGNAADNLSKRFGVSMGKGWAFDRLSHGGITTQLDFSRENGLLGTHAILRGRDATEEVRKVRSFTGQSLGVPAGAAVLLKLSSTAREAATPADLDAEGAASLKADSPSSNFGSHSSDVGGRAQGVAMNFGKGKVAVFGEAGLFTAQIVRFNSGNQRLEQRFGMNVPGNDNRQLVLNVLHWLSGILREGE